MADSDSSDIAQQIVDAIALAEWEEARAEVEAQIAGVARATAIYAAGQFGLSVDTDPDAFHMVDTAAVDWSQQRSAELVGMRVLEDGSIVPNPNPLSAVTDGTRTLLRGTITQALEEGWDAQTLRENLRENYAFSSARASTIARTEVIRAHSQASMIAAKASGRVKTKEWLRGAAQTDCEICEDNQAQGPIPLDDEFLSGDECPGAHPNCSCDLIYSTEEAA